MGYVAYNIYIIELHNMFSGGNDIRKEIDIIQGIYDYTNSEWKYNTKNKSHNNFVDMKPSYNQEGGAEYTYNFWLYVNKNELRSKNTEKKDIALFLKGETEYVYYNKFNYNCSNRNNNNLIIPTLITKNPLVRINHDGSKLAIDYNNILSPDSYQNNSTYESCGNITPVEWKDKNNNLLGIWDIPFDNKWFMITIVIKEVSDRNNILSINRALCKIYVNGMVVFDEQVETKYGSDTVASPATPKHNSSPIYINPDLKKNILDGNDMGKKYNQFFDTNELKLENTLKIGDLKYFNYAINDEIISGIYGRGVRKNKALKDEKITIDYNKMVGNRELEESTIKKLL
tara:strand:+ start:18491 stop:19519 length:1029 start_codon:yes stop_codon:yes gene_type:complete